MIDQTTLITYLAILLGFVIIPGPAVLLTLARASSSGTRVGVATGLGIAAGDLTHTVLAVVGISAVVMASAILFTVLKYLGAAYLVYLGIRAILDRVEPDYSGGSRTLSATLAFRQAVFAEILNPKSAMFFLAFLPQFVKPQNGAVWLQLIQLGVLFVVIGLLTTMVVAVSAGRIGVYLRRNPTIAKWQGKFVGSIYCALGFRVALQER
ncbi:Homoserine/homoserine lactone efflux protein [Granulosicoccus antarcticus IMCC3135]|uniref:Homoserine/homoserine lactone efflux protein n=1 Tax=Granulosicoccus antarcticus IMCC3135 TaxID=1192854 RepID=A0A2Z2NP94_9GAMM|nr:Homoserine/homoserine lactone efflux protein [Granulosicoccus antarcticus IMCC3135]